MRLYKLLSVVVILIGSCLYGSRSSLYAQTVEESKTDTLRVARFRVSKTTPESSKDLSSELSADLKTPENLIETTEYDEKDNAYKVGVKLGEDYLSVPILMTPEEYNRWNMNRSMQSYFKSRNQEAFQNAGKDKFDFTDMKFDLGPAEKIFGPGGVQIKTKGSAAIKLGATRNVVKNPSLATQNRKTFGFDFDEQINLSVNASVGDKISMDMNYNTEATFNFDTKKIRLHYEGKEDEIIKLFEAGNVSFPTNSSLIQGGTSLFGIRTDLQFGKLKLQTVISQKNSSSSTVSSRGGEQLTDFEIEASSYDENRNFFLAHYFRDNYDRNMAMLPSITSGIKITRVELWVTNKRSSYDSPRNIIAFTDLGETRHISNDRWSVSGGPEPENNVNTLYSDISNNYPNSRDIDRVATTLGTFLSGSNDYEKISNARKLTSEDYTINSTLGYISLRSALTSDEVLAVAYEYTYNGRTYQVGEFSSDITDSGKALYVKLLKSNSNTPGTGTWDLMMKNIYSLGSGSLSKKEFKLDVYYASDNTGSRLTYLPEQTLKNRTLLKIMNLDRLDEKQAARSNGAFDYIEEYTVQSSTGRIIFPVVEPFGSHLKKVIGNDSIADKYVFQELYDSTKVVAKRIAEKDKFLLIGRYSGSSNSVIQLGSTNIPKGSVIVTAGGATLVENGDYIIDYSMGTVTIINQNIIDAGTSVSVQMESNTEYSMQRKTMTGLNWIYDFNENLQLGGTLLHLNERPLTSKVSMGDEPLVNTMYGLNLNWKHESQAITNIIDLLPFVNTTKPSSIKFSAEMAKLKSDVSDKVQGNSSYIDDFEAAESGIDISRPSAWSLSGVPTGQTGYNLSNDVRSGYNRALLNWFTIDPLFTRRNSSLTPAHIKSDMDQLSNHYVREVYERELFPNKESISSESTTLSVLNLAYYPNERGPYNLNPDVTPEGYLNNPADNWGGIMRSLSTTDFEAANIEYIEFWMLDPFIYDTNSSGGDLYINLGEVSEDVLSDGKKFFENGLPVDGDTKKYAETVWGKVPTVSSLVYAFDNSSANSRKMQDVGLNGISTEDERTYPAYSDYLSSIQGKVSADTYKSFYDDPSGDNYHYFRGNDYDDAKMSILDRYKKYNGTEGNSPNNKDTNESFDQSSKTTPDMEDANSDHTLDEYEKFFQYRISLRPSDLTVGKNYISDKREVKVKLRNGKTESVNWYCFRIPVDEYEKAVGSIRDFSSIRFMRIYLTNFTDETHIRFGTMELMTSQWRNYEQPIASFSNERPTVSGQLSVTSVNIEENGDRKPVNYVIPPGITRILDPAQTQLVQDNEQAMSIKVTNLDAGEARGIYKKSALDLRKYQHIQMFTHAESLIDDAVGIGDGDLSVFIRLGSDYTSNYYEYEIPLKVTPEGFYSKDNETDRRIVWPSENMLDLDFEVLTNIKNSRNNKQNQGLLSSNIYSEYDPNNPDNRVSVVGNPTIGNVRAIMVGVRNNSRSRKSAEVWVNELRLIGYESKGGMAAHSNLSMQLSDIGSINLAGQMSTAGFGGLEQSIGERSMDNAYKYSMTTSFNLGRFIPEKAKVSIPIYYSYTKEQISPLYSPYDTDLKLEDVKKSFSDTNGRDSINSLTSDLSVQKNFSISGAKINISSDKPMPYDPANFSLSYSNTIQENSSSTIEYENNKNWKASLSYSYSPSIEGWKPFAFIEYRSRWLDILKETTINFVPQNFTFNTDLLRNYHELQDRDLENRNAAEKLPVTFSQQFNWNRDISLRWDLLAALNLDLTARTNAEIEEPYVVVNKDLYPDLYDLWKDSVKMSLMRMGRPLDYQQTFKASYQIPLSKLPILNWTQSDISYSSQYSWDRGMTYSDGSSYGNAISNQRNISVNGSLNLQNLYNKSKYLQKVNDKFKSGKIRNNTPAKKSERFQREFTFVPDSTYTIEHGQNTLRPSVTATKKDGTTVKLKFKKPDSNTITIKVKDTLQVLVKIVQDPNEINRTNKVGINDGIDFAARMLMMARSASFTYNNSYSMSLPGFMPYASTLGQSSNGSMMAPGLGFAFGMTGNEFINKAKSNNWLLDNDSVTYSAASTAGQDLQVRMVLEPFTDFKINLNSSWTKSNSRTIQYMYSGMPESQTGTFSMTVISMGSAFERGKAGNGYSSKSFDRFIRNINTSRQMVESKYQGAVYPDGTALGGQTYDPANGGVNIYSADVLIPAFLSAYTGRDVSDKLLNLFPSILSMMPNWSITYGGLSKIPEIGQYFKSFNIRHAYKSVYSMGSYNTFSSYMEYMNGLGFIKDVTSGNPIPNSMYNVSSVSINESFAPLIGVDMTFNNGLTAKLEMRKTHIMNLSTSAVQLVETRSNDITAGAGYKITKLKFLGAKSGSGSNKVSNDLNINMDFSYRNQNSLCRNIKTYGTQATNGNRAIKMSLTADYTYSKMLTLNFYYDFQSNFPLVSTTSYPTSTHDCGITLKFALTK